MGSCNVDTVRTLLVEESKEKILTKNKGNNRNNTSTTPAPCTRTQRPTSTGQRTCDKVRLCPQRRRSNFRPRMMPWHMIRSTLGIALAFPYTGQPRHTRPRPCMHSNHCTSLREEWVHARTGRFDKSPACTVPDSCTHHTSTDSTPHCRRRARTSRPRHSFARPRRTIHPLRTALSLDRPRNAQCT